MSAEETNVVDQDDDARDYEDPNVCQDLKALHDRCFYDWYHNEFLKGVASDEEPCLGPWRIYQACVRKRLQALGLEHLMDDDDECQDQVEETHVDNE
jgi:Uncharacterised protein family (UPF0203)